jgi:D-3-phosphoglycerate dehydrogenase
MDMKMVIIEPLGVPEDRLMKMAAEVLPGVDVKCYGDRAASDDGIIERTADADIVVAANQPLSGDAIRGMKKCRFLDIAFTGVDHVDLDAAKEMGITVSNCAGYSTAAVSELVFGMLITLQRNIIACDKAVRSGGTKDGLVGPELEGRTFGVIGTGAIGTRVAQIALAFGCRVLAYSRTVKDIPGVEYVSLDELMKESDIVSIHVPSNAETKGMIDREHIGMMKKNAVLINLARGPIVDSRALADALNTGNIAGACVDVFEMEPPIPEDHPLLSAKNTVLTPHVAFASEQAMIKRAVIVFDNAKKFIDGEPQNVI